MFHIVLLAAMSVLHDGKLPDYHPIQDQAIGQYAYVRSCGVDDAFVPVYEDKDLTIALPNPIPLSGGGFYHFYTTSPFVAITIQMGNRIDAEIDTCPGKEK